MFISIQINAQYVTVGDFYFQRELELKYPACFDTLGRLDTTCNEILATKKYDSFKSYANSIDEIKFFKNLDTLILVAGDLNHLDLLPPKLKYIDISRNFNLSEIPDYMLVDLKYLNFLMIAILKNLTYFLLI